MSGVAADVEHLLADIEHGRFERSLAALTAVASIVAGAEIFLEHDRASFGNRTMWVPIALTPPTVAVGVAGVFSRRMAKVALPIVSAAVVANGIQGTYLHVRGVAQRPGGWKFARYNMEMGPPVMAPMLFAVVGGMGLLASILRREGRR